MRAKCFVCVILLTFLLVGCASARETPYQPAVSSTLVVLGDSVSAGQYVPSADAYPRLLAADLHAQLIVYAVPGHTTAQTFSMYIGELAPTYVVIELGTNDYNASVPLPIFAQDYQDVVASISPATREVCLSIWDPGSAADTAWSSRVGIPSPVNKVGASPRMYNAIIAHLCRGTYLSLQALYDTPGYHGSGAPGLIYHPNGAGDAAIARLVYRAFSSSQVSRNEAQLSR